MILQACQYAQLPAAQGFTVLKIGLEIEVNYHAHAACGYANIAIWQINALQR